MELSLRFGAGSSLTIPTELFPSSAPGLEQLLPSRSNVFPAAIVDIVQSQKCGKILVGDPHQQIYTFRGAVNTLYALPHTHVYYLTQVRASFSMDSSQIQGKSFNSHTSCFSLDC